MKLRSIPFSTLCLSVALLACNTGGEARPDGVDAADSTAVTTADATATVGGLETETYTTPSIRGWKATMQKPKALDVSILGDGMELKYIGPEALPETEITDGIWSSIMPSEGSDASGADEMIRGYFLAPVGEISDVEINGTPAKKYRAEDAMEGEPTYNYLFVLEPTVMINVVYSPIGARADEYGRAMEAMVETMVWEKG